MAISMQKTKQNQETWMAYFQLLLRICQKAKAISCWSKGNVNKLTRMEVILLRSNEGR